MSADDGIYILECDDGFRVRRLHSVGNMDVVKDDYHDYCAYIYVAFHKCQVFKTKESAISYAQGLQNQVLTEHGVWFLPRFKGNFPYHISKKPVNKEPKEKVTIRLDKDVVDKFKRGGKGKL